MIRRRWVVLRTTNDKITVVGRAWTRRGAWRQRNYLRVLMDAVGIDVAQEPRNVS